MLLLNEMNSVLVALHDSTVTLHHCVNGICIQKPIACHCLRYTLCAEECALAECQILSQQLNRLDQMHFCALHNCKCIWILI